ncbi:AAA family ATPase [Paraburkholderia caribensis]|uniref:AAA family ATPase n=1 Tax=Paraburkholderia caribensis TaxID=75105 RepID=UPI0028602AF0|nr:AAA family ATPase [Paraburkholderia caribensis]MDR6381787.1 energy-coupling factor transporter ATP-binding protein EcfA2 [Paraburkholderia caribensis]
MQIQHITVKSFIGARAVDVSVDTPVTIFAGPNGAGKSSLREAISAALTGDITRVALKKEYPSMVTEGSKKAIVSLDLDVGPANLTLPDARHVGLTVYTGALPYLLHPERFAQMKPDERRTFLFELTGLRATPEKVKTLLIERKCDEKKVEKVLPMMRSGFPAAVKFAEDEARETKGAWKAVTGEQWGKDKGEGWEAEVPLFDSKRHGEVVEQLAATEKRLTAASTELGALQEKHRAYIASRETAERSAEVAKGLSRIEEKLATDRKHLAEAEERLKETELRAGTAPREGLVHDLARGIVDFAAIMAESDGVAGYHQNGAVAAWGEFDLTIMANALQAYEAQFGPVTQTGGDVEARARLPELTKARDLMKRAVENDERDLAAAHGATEALKLKADVEVVTDEQLTGARTSVTAATSQRDNLRSELDKLNAAKRAAEAADSKTEQAAKHHTDITQWLDIAAALAPDGIPGDMLAQAIAPINHRLAELAAFAEWAVPSVDADMTIRAGGRLYSLLSESEKYRVDALIALTIAVLSESRIVFFDRFDVLDLKGRADLLALLDDMASQNEIATALVFGTLKKVPEGLAPTTRAHWIENGELLAARIAQAA